MNVFDISPPSCHFGDRPSPPAAPDLLHISTEQLLISTWRLSKGPVYCGSRLAGEPCSMPHQLLHISEARWDVLCLFHHHSATQFRNNLSFRLQPVLLARFPRLLETQKNGPPLIPTFPRTTSHKQCRRRDCHQLLLLPFFQLSVSFCPLLCSDAFRTSKVLLNGLPSASSYSCTTIS